MAGGTEWLTAQNEADDYKQRILEQAEANWDDEYDDTYDDALLAVPGASEGEGGERQDTTGNDGDDKSIAGPSGQRETNRSNTLMPLPATDPTAPFETMLLAEAVANPEMFARNKAARQSKQRQALLAKTKLSNEQLEGWYSMLNRDARGKHKLEAYKLSRDASRPAHQTSQRSQPSSSTATGTIPASRQQGKGSAQRSDVQPGPQKPSSTRGGRPHRGKANHNRKNQHAKKMRQFAPSDA
ncbi:hypothetical protein H4R35_006507 [Dimargaris xerosporica]|nr:hypothetical protein H4R35_006507 [Dimargaris xerosporica]